MFFTMFDIIHPAERSAFSIAGLALYTTSMVNVPSFLAYFQCVMISVCNSAELQALSPPPSPSAPPSSTSITPSPAARPRILQNAESGHCMVGRAHASARFSVLVLLFNFIMFVIVMITVISIPSVEHFVSCHPDSVLQ
jgi:hypothetical protein